MRSEIRFGMGIEAGRVLYKLTSFVCGLMLLPAMGLILVGAYLPASVLLCLAVAVPRGVWWLVTRRRRRA